MAMATTLERTSTSRLRGLRCRACHVLQPADERYICGECYGPIEPEYDCAAFDTEALRDEIERGPHSLWRYAPLLPVAAPRGHFAVGWTPLIRAPRLGAAIGVAQLFLKDDSRNPSLSFKDRPVAVALARPLELGLDTIACASTGHPPGPGAPSSRAPRPPRHSFAAPASPRARSASTRHNRRAARPCPTPCSVGTDRCGRCAIRSPSRGRSRSARPRTETGRSRSSARAADPPD